MLKVHPTPVPRSPGVGESGVEACGGFRVRPLKRGSGLGTCVCMDPEGRGRLVGAGTLHVGLGREGSAGGVSRVSDVGSGGRVVWNGRLRKGPR